MRTLVLSIGNSTAFGGVFSAGRLVKRFRISHGRDAGQAAFVRALRDVLPAEIERAAVCSVVPARTRPALAWIRRVAGVRAQVLTAAAVPGVSIAYRRPSELGTDRLAAALGARARWPGRDVIVVDCGTATTVTALRRDGRILGGAIFPGLALWPEVLARRTARLPRVAPVRPRRALGRSPVEALQSGIFYGHAGAIREVVRLVGTAAFGRTRALVVGTGGNATGLASEKLFTVLDPDLILTGLFAFATQDIDHA